MHEGQELVRRAASSFGFMKLARRKHKISFFIADWHSDLRHRSGFEPPLSKSIDRGFIENRITGALLHGRIGHFADRGINRHNANPAASDMGVLRLVGVHGGRGANDLSFCGGQGHHIRSGRFGRSLGCRKGGVACVFTLVSFFSFTAGVASSLALGVSSGAGTGF